MVRKVNDTALDQMLQYVKDRSTALWVLSSATAAMTHANASAWKLASATITSTLFTGPADGDTSGRKITVASVANVSIETSGSAPHFALIQFASGTLEYVTPASTVQAVTAGNTMTTDVWTIEVRDPTAP